MLIPPTLPSEVLLRADERAIEDAASEASGEAAAQLTKVADELQHAREAVTEAQAEAERVRSAVDERLEISQSALVMAHRIAGYAGELIKHRPDDFEKPIEIAGFTWQGKAGTVALVAIAFFRGHGVLDGLSVEACIQAGSGQPRYLRLITAYRQIHLRLAKRHCM